MNAMTLCLLFSLLVPLAGLGLASINAGLGRSRSAAHVMLASLSVMAVAALVYFVCGFAWQGFPGLPAHVFVFAGKPWNWLAAGPFFLRGLALDGSPASLAAWLGMLSAGLAALIPLGSGADRWRLGASCASAALLAGVTYPVFAHWVWGGGWLAQLGVNNGLGAGFLDAGGSSSIQAVGGLTALSIAWILGPRRGKYAPDGSPSAIPGHNAVLVLFGCLAAWVGWLGLDCAGAVLYYGLVGHLVRVAMNTTLGACAAALATAALTRARFGKPDASLCANGWVAGLVAGSAGCAFVPPALAVLTGAVAGALVVFAVEWFELRFAVDDPGGAVAVHAVGGIWGIVAVGLFAGGPGQLLAQIAGLATLLGFVLPLTYGLNFALDRFYRQRVNPEGERRGMDLFELGAGAYPEFMTHTDDFAQR
jgi:Amt family ammonium transporter